MPGIVALRDLISLDCTTSLVNAGYLAPWLRAGEASSVTPTTLSITGATNASPIVITTSTTHGVKVGTAAHIVISGVGGNTAANNFDSGEQLYRAWHAVALTTTTLALFSINVATGAAEASTGNGAYTSGGSVKKALVDGLILLGRQHSYEQSSPPRILFIPRRGNFAAKDVYNRSQVSGFPSAELMRQTSQRSIRTENVLLEVHCWGAATPPEPDADFDATQVLYQQIVRSSQLLYPGTYDLENGLWQDQEEGASQLIKEGHLFVFGLVIGTPVLARAMGQVPRPIAPLATTNLEPSDGGASQVGCSDNP